MAPLRPRSDLVLTDLTGQPVPMTVEEVSQRAWSRTARASGDATAPWFLKQFHGRDGQWHKENFHDEALGARLASEHLASFRVSPLLGRSDEQLVLGYPYRRLATADELLRGDPNRFQTAWPLICDGLPTLVSELAEAVSPGIEPGLTLRRRPYTSSGEALLFKGLDVRNLGWSQTESRLCVFDVGRPYVGPIEEAAAKLFVSVGLLNWGRPVSRFRTGPPIPLVEQARSALDRWLLPEAIHREVDTQFAGRRRSAVGRNAAERMGRRLLVGSIGRAYVRQLLAWCANHGL